MASSLLPNTIQTSDRNVKKVPFVELHGNRLQGVVSSGSDIMRVYVAFFEVNTLNFSCSTNNNRPCGGVGGGCVCNHLQNLLEEAIAQYGIERVVRFLLPSADATYVTSSHDLLRKHRGQKVDDPSSAIFSRFLSHLTLLEQPAADQPLATTAWFG